MLNLCRHFDYSDVPSQKHNLWQRLGQEQCETTLRDVAEGGIMANTDNNMAVIFAIQVGCLKRGFGSEDFERSFQAKVEQFTTANNY